jgi:hypothetical protein
MLGLNGLRPLVLALALSGGGLWSTLVDQLANLSGAGCHAIESWHVQLKGAPFCQATTGSGEYYAQGRTQRVIAATALGVTISFFMSRTGSGSIGSRKPSVRTMIARCRSRAKPSVPCTPSRPM